MGSQWHLAELGLGDASQLEWHRVLGLQPRGMAWAQQLEHLMQVKSSSAQVGLGCCHWTGKLVHFGV